MRLLSVFKTPLLLAVSAGLIFSGISPVFADSGSNENAAPALSNAALASGKWRTSSDPGMGQIESFATFNPQATSVTPSSNNALLSYRGGTTANGTTVGVTTGSPKVYLVFWGSQWGSAATPGAGDPKGMADYLTRFIKGIGTNNETWSSVMTQYCEGIAAGQTSCPAGSTARVGYPTGGALAGVWFDNSAAAPSAATASQLGEEAAKAAMYFGKNTQASNRSTQYVVVSPTGTKPDGFNNGGGFCAYHSNYKSKTVANSPAGVVTFTNLPYLLDLGASCGQNYVNAGDAGLLDGVSIVEGHEYAETITDQWPAGGWYENTGGENGDKCSWLAPSTGGSGNVVFSTGAFAMQSTFSNADVGCVLTNPLTVATSISAAQQNKAYSAKAIVGGNLPLTFSSVSGLPGGITLNADGSITGIPTTSGSTTIAFSGTDASGLAFSGSVALDVAAAVTSGTTVTLASSANTISFGTTATFSATLASGSTKLSGGIITFYDGTTSAPLGTATTNTSGVATFSSKTLTVATHTIFASFGGTSAYLASSSQSLPIVVTGTVSGAPGKPSLSTTKLAGSGINATWTAPTSTGGSAITGYVVTVYSGTSSTVVTPVTVVYSGTSAQITGLTAGKSYSVAVAAINTTGTSAQSARSSAATAK